MEKKNTEKEVQVIKHLYKKDCGFREKANVCSFKVEDCNPKECDFFNIEYSLKGIKEQIKLERNSIVELDKEKKLMKQNKLHKIEPEKYKKIKNNIKDKAIGVYKLAISFKKIKQSK